MTECAFNVNLSGRTCVCVCVTIKKITVFFYLCVCMCVCVCVRARDMQSLSVRASHQVMRRICE